MIADLTARRDAAFEEFEAARKASEVAIRKAREAKARFRTWQRALDDECAAYGLPPDRKSASLAKGKTIAELAARFIDQEGPLTTGELRERFAELERDHSVSTIGLALRRRPDLLVCEGGRWDLGKGDE